MNSDYEKILDWLKNRLTKQAKISKNDIINKINNIRNMLSSKDFREMFDIEQLSEIDYSMEQDLIKDIETEFNVTMPNCIEIKGDAQKARDNTWWTHTKNNNDLVVWDFYKNKLEYPNQIIRTLDMDTDCVLNNLFNPKDANIVDSRYGMVIGHVQSGKTSNYSGVICKAIDAGYKFFIIIAGIHNNLRSQTQKRIESIFSNISKDKHPIFLTTTTSDFKKESAKKFSSLNFDNTNVPFFLIIKKHSKVLDEVIKWVENDNNSVPMLLIDDEADNATINTKTTDDPTTINKKIRQLLAKFNKYCYVGYTATPFANIFIDHEAQNNNDGQDLFPRDFIIALDAPSNYQGAKKLFLQENNNIISIDEIENLSDAMDYYTTETDEEPKFAIPRNHKKNYDPQKLPYSLLLAIRMFYINIAIRNLRRQTHKYNSMLIHATRFTEVHSAIAKLVEDYTNKIRKDFRLYGLVDIKKSDIISDFESDFNYYYNVEFSWDEVLQQLNSIYNSVIVIESHCNSKQVFEYTEDQSNIIAVGGNSLSRGFTLEGLSISYFLRNACASDTLMQMARWFGYRPNYEDICKIFLPSDIISNFEAVADSSDELYDLVKIMKDEGQTPEKFGLRVKTHPGSILITARNKMKAAKDFEAAICLDGQTKESSKISSNSDIINDNLQKLNQFVTYTLQSYQVQNNGPNKYLFQGIPTKDINDFINNFHFVDNYIHFPIECIKEYLHSYNDLWRVALIGVENSKTIVKLGNYNIGAQERVVTLEGNNYILGKNRQMTTGLVEKWGFTQEEFENLKNRFDTVKMRRGDLRHALKEPVLMIHIITNNGKQTTIKNDKLPSLSFTFPIYDIARESRTVKYKINTVYWQNIQRQLEEENDTDDE